MKSKKQFIKSSYLYLILDKDSYQEKYLIPVLKSLDNTLIDLVQFRAPLISDNQFYNIAKRIRSFCKGKGIGFIINNRCDIAIALGADGVHLGENDLPIDSARKILGKNKIIGITCRSLDNALKAQIDGADYIGIGPVFKSPLKPKLKTINHTIIKQVKKRISIPFFAIGGITTKNICQLVNSGIERIAVCSALCCNPNQFRNTALKLRCALRPGK